MALDQNKTGFNTWVDADVAEEARFGQTDFENAIQDLIAAANNAALLTNAWSQGDDVWDHFTRDETNRAGYQLDNIMSGSSSVSVPSGEHYLQVVTGGGVGKAVIYTDADRRIDRVETVFEVRLKVSSFAATVDPFLGFTVDETAAHDSSPPADGCWFERGTNSNTWKCITRQGGSVQTTTDNQTGNYTSWDVLRIEFTEATAKFYINGTLVATHSTNLPTTVALHGIAYFIDSGAASATMSIDYFRYSASENATSP